MLQMRVSRKYKQKQNLKYFYKHIEFSINIMAWMQLLYYFIIKKKEFKIKQREINLYFLGW